MRNAEKTIGNLIDKVNVSFISSIMNKILVFIYDGMADFEITPIAHILGTDLGKEIITIAYENKIVRSLSGLEYKPKKLVKEVINDDVEGLVITGGWNGENDPFPREGFINDRVVVDKNLITSQGIAFIDFTCEICDWFKFFKNEDEKIQFLKTLKG